MKHRRLFGLLSAAAVALGSVPVLPVFAADADIPAISGTTIENGYVKTEYKKGSAGTYETGYSSEGAFSFRWDGIQNGAVRYGKYDEERSIYDVVPSFYEYAGTLDLGDYGFFGVDGIVRSADGADAAFRIVEGWGQMSDVRQRAGEKLGEITVDGVEYEVFRSVTKENGSEKETTTYWSIRNLNRYDAPRKNTVEGTVSVGAHLKKMEAFGLPYQKYHSIALFADTGEKEGGTVSGSADFTENQLVLMVSGPAEFTSGTTNEGYYWWHDRAGSGSSVIDCGENGKFTAKWTESAHVSMGCGRFFGSDPFWHQLGQLRYDYACTADISGSAYLGLNGFLKDSGFTTEFYIVDGWTGNRPPITESGELLGTISVYGDSYDVYFKNMTQESITGAYSYLYQFWSVRKENALKTDGTLKNNVDAGAHFAEWQNLNPSKVGRKLAQITAFASGAWDASTATISFTKNTLLTDPSSDTGEYYYESSMQDGYTWKRIQKGLGHNSLLTPAENGCFRAEWGDVSEDTTVLFTNGIQTNRIQDTKDLSALQADYSLDCEFDDDAFFGTVCTFMDTAPTDHKPDTMEMYVIDGWGTERPVPDASYKLGTTALDGEDSSYDVYLIPVSSQAADSAPVIPLDTTKQQCLIVRQDSKYKAGEQQTVSASHDMVKIIQTVEALGVNFPAWRDCASFIQANSGFGRVAATRNAISYTYNNDYHSELWKTGKTADGYTWEHWVAAGDAGFEQSVMDPGKDGQFSCSWKNARDARHSSGLQFPEGTPWDSVGNIRCDYALKMESEGVVYAGIYGYLTGYTTEFYIIDAWTGAESLLEALKQGLNITELGTITADGAVYDTFVGINPQMDINGTRAIPQYYAVRRENLANSDGTVTGSTDVTAFLSAWKQNGMDAPDLALVTLLVEGGCCWGEPEACFSGKAEVTKNAFTVKKEEAAQLLKPAVKGDANCDDRMDISDAVLVARVVNEDKTAVITEQGMANGDVDGQKGLTASDITYLLQAIAKKILL